MSSTYRRGAVLILVTATLWSTAGLLVGAVTVDAWSILFWRSAFAFGFLLVYLALTDRRPIWLSLRYLGWPGLVAAVCFAVSMICFILALSLTTVATVMVLAGCSPFMAAIAAWALMGERMSVVTLASVLLALGGVVVMVAGLDARSDLIGILLAAAMTVGFAGVIVLARRYRALSMTPAMCLAAALTALVSLIMAPTIAVTGPELGLLAVFGIGQMGIALVTFTAGARLIPAADVGLLSMLELVLAPFWTWLAYSETVDTPTLIGGAIVIAAIVLQTLWQRRTEVQTA